MEGTTTTTSATELIKMEAPDFTDVSLATIAHHAALGGDESDIFKYFLNEDSDDLVPTSMISEPMDLSTVADMPFATPSVISAFQKIAYSSPSSDSHEDEEEAEAEDNDRDPSLDETSLPSSSTPSPPTTPSSPQPNVICPKALHSGSTSRTSNRDNDPNTMPHNPRKRARVESPSPPSSPLFSSSGSDPLLSLTTEQLKKLSSKTLEAYAQNLAASGSLSAEAEKQIKKHRRLIKNRESAQLSRLRKKMYIDELERKVSHISTQNDALTKRNAFLTQENKALRDEVAYLHGVIKQNPALAAAAAAGRKPLSNNVKAAGVCLLIVLFSFGLIFNSRKPLDGMPSMSILSDNDEMSASLLRAFGSEVLPGASATAVRRGGRVLTSIEDAGKTTDNVSANGETDDNTASSHAASGKKRKRDEVDDYVDPAIVAEAQSERATSSVVVKSEPASDVITASAVDSFALATAHNAHKRVKLMSTPNKSVTAEGDVEMTDASDSAASSVSSSSTTDVSEEGNHEVNHAPHRAAASESTSSTYLMCPLSTVKEANLEDNVILPMEDDSGAATSTVPLTDAAAELSTRLLRSTASQSSAADGGLVALLVPSDLLRSGLGLEPRSPASLLEVSCQVLNVNVFPALPASPVNTV